MKQEKIIVKEQKGGRMKLYTFLMQYGGGTYIEQVHASDETNAMRIWLKQLNVGTIKGFTEKNREKLIKNDFVDEEPVLIEGCLNIWCFGIRIKKELALVNFVQTEV